MSKKYKLSEVEYLYHYMTSDINFAFENGNICDFSNFIKKHSYQHRNTSSPAGDEYFTLEQIFKIYNPCENNFPEELKIFINELICSRNVDNQRMVLSILQKQKKTKNKKSIK